MSPFRRPQVPKADEFRILYVALMTLYRFLTQSFLSLEKKVVGKIITFSSLGQNLPHQPDHPPSDQGSQGQVQRHGNHASLRRRLHNYLKSHPCDLPCYLSIFCVPHLSRHFNQSSRLFRNINFCLLRSLLRFENSHQLSQLNRNKSVNRFLRKTRLKSRSLKREIMRKVKARLTKRSLA